MKIAQICKPWQTVPPVKYGGIERVMYFLSEELSRDHEVTLFAPGTGSWNPRIHLRALFTEGQGAKGYDRNLELVQLLDAVQHHLQRSPFDVLHVHGIDAVIGLACVSKLPLMVSNYSVPTPTSQMLTLAAPDHLRFVFASHAHRRTYPWITNADVVHAGIPVERYPFSEQKDDYVVFIGAIRPEKGVVEAMDTARLADRRLVIAGSVRPEFKTYFAEEFEPRLKEYPNVTYLGEVTGQECSELSRHAAAFLFPVKWEEPFNIAILESLAVGTPVVAFDRPSVREAIEHGRNGLIVENVQEMAEAIRSIHVVRPRDCRQTVETRFHSRMMADAYAVLYRKYF